MDPDPSMHGDVPICGKFSTISFYFTEQPFHLTIHPSARCYFQQLTDNGKPRHGEFGGWSSSNKVYMVGNVSSQVPVFSDFDSKETDDQSGYQTTTSSRKL
jgi:hypothetical protein